MADGGQIFDATGTTGLLREGLQFCIIPEIRDSCGEKGQSAVHYGKIVPEMYTVYNPIPCPGACAGRRRGSGQPTQGCAPTLQRGAEGGFRWLEDARTEEGSRFWRWRD